MSKKIRNFLILFAFMFLVNPMGIKAEETSITSIDEIEDIKKEDKEKIKEIVEDLGLNIVEVKKASDYEWDIDETTNKKDTSKNPKLVDFYIVELDNLADIRLYLNKNSIKNAKYVKDTFTMDIFDGDEEINRANLKYVINIATKVEEIYTIKDENEVLKKENEELRNAPEIEIKNDVPSQEEIDIKKEREDFKFKFYLMILFGAIAGIELIFIIVSLISMSSLEKENKKIEEEIDNVKNELEDTRLNLDNTKALLQKRESQILKVKEVLDSDKQYIKKMEKCIIKLKESLDKEKGLNASSKQEIEGGKNLDD